MSDLQWKNNPIKRMHGRTEYDEPTLADYVEWVDATLRAVEAVRAEWIKTAIEEYEKMDVLVQMFVDADQLDASGKVDYKSIPFKRKIVEFAVACGREFRWDYPVANNEKTKQAFDRIKLNLSSFGLQIQTAARVHRSNVFIANDKQIKEHPLHCIIEWHLLEKSFNQHKKSLD
mmetsp:Transcript_3498/g.5062  ORF Transcript_3498/g.5062 Transcript_3498/m.5062 type:complete len:174 (-) Transcript_3498:3069-3590(-)